MSEDAARALARVAVVSVVAAVLLFGAVLLAQQNGVVAFDCVSRLPSVARESRRSRR